MATDGRTAGPDLAALVEAHQREVWRYLRFLGCDEALADDLTQETFLAVFRQPFAVQSRAATSSYLRTTARNFYLKHRNARSPQAMDEADAVWERYAEPDGGDSYREALRACVAGLEGREKEALDRRFRDGLSPEEAARKFGLAAEGLKTLLRRVKERLKECVEQRLRREA